MAMISNVKKTIYYLERNGLKKTYHAVRERLSGGEADNYSFVPVSEEELGRQRQALQRDTESGKSFPLISILVPAYRTKESFLRELIDSVIGQSYPYWELVFADATQEDDVYKVIASYDEERIKYVKLSQNDGISNNTNQGLDHVTGDYVGLLDHDDLLTPNALYEMYQELEKGKNKAYEIPMLYSDEDKCDGEAKTFYEPNQKEDFNLDLLLSNNYICHFLVVKRELMTEIRFRKEYDGAQDYDFILRAVSRIQKEKETEQRIVHIPKVLYHWRCHQASTAENPKSKEYAYEAGRRALQDFAAKNEMDVQAVHLSHLGFYRLDYKGQYFEARPDIAMVGGRVIEKGKIIGGRMDEQGNIFYQHMPKEFSGPLHRAVLTQDAYAVDFRNMSLREDCIPLFHQVVGVDYVARSEDGKFDVTVLPREMDLKEKSLQLAKKLHEEGYLILWDPMF